MRTVTPKELDDAKNHTLILDVRRKDDFENSAETIAGSAWKDPTLVDEWAGTIPKDQPVVIFCARGGGVSNSVVDRLLAEGVQARYLEGGIEAMKDAGGVTQK